MHRSHQKSYIRWVEALINDYIEEFRKEYDVSSADAFMYFFDTDKLERIKALFKEHDIEVEIYDVEGLSSKGIVIPEDNPTVVMYKLRYSDPPSES
jgi:hypothetical protein